MSRWEYYAPECLDDVWPILERFGNQARLLAGGTDLLIEIGTRAVRPSCLIDLKRIPELGGIHNEPNGETVLSPLTTVAELAEKGAACNLAVLAEAARTVGSPQVRNRATLGGNICRAAPSADLIPALLVLDAAIVLQSAATQRTLPLCDFLIGPGKTTLREGEIVRAIRIPPRPSPLFAVYLKHGPRRTMDLATVGAAVAVHFDPPSVCRRARIAIASVAPTTLRARSAEEILYGSELTPGAIGRAVKAAAEEARPISDTYGPDWYKREIVAVLVRRALEEIMRRTKEAGNGP